MQQNDRLADGWSGRQKPAGADRCCGAQYQYLTGHGAQCVLVCPGGREHPYELTWPTAMCVSQNSYTKHTSQVFSMSWCPDFEVFCMSWCPDFESHKAHGQHRRPRTVVRRGLCVGSQI